MILESNTCFGILEFIATDSKEIPAKSKLKSELGSVRVGGEEVEAGEDLGLENDFILEANREQLAWLKVRGRVTKQHSNNQIINQSSWDQTGSYSYMPPRGKVSFMRLEPLWCFALSLASTDWLLRTSRLLDGGGFLAAGFLLA